MKDKTLEPPEITIEIPKWKLEKWVQMLRDAESPRIEYQRDLEAMLRAAYERRTELITELIVLLSEELPF